MRKRTIAVFALTIAVLAGTGIGIAYASIPGSDGAIHGCYKTSNPARGAVIVIDSAASCPSGYAALNWPSLTGNVASASRAEQLRLVEEVTSPNIRDGIPVTQAVATCPAGYKVTGGGVEVDPSGTAYQDNVLIQSTRYRWTDSTGSYDSWLVEYSSGPDGEIGSFKAIAMCVNAAYWWQDGAGFQQPPASPPYPGNS